MDYTSNFHFLVSCWFPFFHFLHFGNTVRRKMRKDSVDAFQISPDQHCQWNERCLDMYSPTRGNENWGQVRSRDILGYQWGGSTWYPFHPKPKAKSWGRRGLGIGAQNEIARRRNLNCIRGCKSKTEETGPDGDDRITHGTSMLNLDKWLYLSRGESQWQI